MFQVPSAATLAGFELVVPVADGVADGLLRVSGAGAEPATKWM
jgi:hypothetical protein